MGAAKRKRDSVSTVSAVVTDADSSTAAASVKRRKVVEKSSCEDDGEPMMEENVYAKEQDSTATKQSKKATHKKTEAGMSALHTSASASSSSSRPLQPSVSALKVKSSALLRPTKTVGTVCDGQRAFSLTRLGTEDFVTVSTGNAFQVFDTSKLRISFISPYFSQKIKAILSVGETTITSFKQHIAVWHKMTEVARFCGGHETKGAKILCKGIKMEVVL
jgi:hypothetical protein